jgi:hypothetical protein
MPADRPALATFATPSIGWFLLLDGGLVALEVLAFSRPAYEKARATVPLPEQSDLRRIFAVAVLLHVGEAFIAHRRATRLGLGESAGKWAAQTLVVGFPSLLAMRRVAKARATT